MTRNAMAYDLPPAMRPKSAGDFKDKPRSVQMILEAHGINRIEQLKALTQEEAEQLRKEVDFFEKHPEIPDGKIADYFREGADLRNSFADVIGEKGRAGLAEIAGSLPKRKVN